MTGKGKKEPPTQKDAPLTIVRARLETRHFDFEVFDVTEASARDRMRALWAVHQTEYTDAVDFDDLFVEDDIQIDVIAVPGAYRDHELKPVTPTHGTPAPGDRRPKSRHNR